MSLNEILLQIGDYILLAGLPGLVLFIIFYATKSPWRSVIAGRTLMYLALSLLGVFVSSLLTLFLGDDYLFRELVRIAVYGAVSTTVWRLFYTLRKVQKSPPPGPIEAAGVVEFKSPDDKKD